MAKVIDYKHDPKIHGPFFGVNKGAISWDFPPSRWKQSADKTRESATAKLGENELENKEASSEQKSDRQQFT